MKIKHFVMLFSACLLISLLPSCSKSGSDATSDANTTTVMISGSSFPTTISVKMGTTIIWKNIDAMAHTVTSDDGAEFSSGNLASGASFSYLAKTAGSFPYHCEYHANMHGTLVVNP
jgi:plastocyanin